MKDPWEENKCYLCGKNGSTDRLDYHHVFNGPFRKKSGQYGAVVQLCHSECHIFGKNSVHQNAEIDNALKAEWQAKLMEENNWTTEDFIREFGKNYI